MEYIQGRVLQPSRFWFAPFQIRPKMTELTQNWRLKFTDPTGKYHEIPAQVPGNVIGDLVRAEILPDPYRGINSHLTYPWESISWEYENTFTSPKLAPGERLRLTLHGADTFFELFINDCKVGSGKNMFVEHAFDITDFLQTDGENSIRITIGSNVNAKRSPSRPAAFDCQPHNYAGWHIRRATHTYGWDVAPRIVGAGLWRKVTLEKVKPTHWRESYLYTQWLNEEKAGMVLHWEFDTDAEDFSGFSAELSLKCGDSCYHETIPVWFNSGRNYFQFASPKLWWPFKSGEQHLYDVSLKLFRNGELCDEMTWRTGIRDIHLERSETNFNGEGKFCFRINNKPIFITGSNWVPADALHGENRERILENVKIFRELNCNMIRCWGGGVYEDHDFFDLCDELGLLVWQDFMLACTIPPQDEEFLQELHDEAVSAVKKLRRHPSLALWCGDNECDQRFFAINDRRNPSMNKATRKVLNEVVFAHDPGRDYLPSSPYFADEVKERNMRYASPEQHLWGARDDWKSPFYLNNSAIFASEIGYLGMPAVESVKKFIPETSLNARSVENPDWLCHAAQPFDDKHGCYAYRIGMIHDQVRGFFGSVPEPLEEFVESSQIVQAEAMKYFVENFRKDKGKRTGIIWWNALDCWPQFSDAVIDYYRNWKLAAHYLKNVQQPVLLMFSEPENWCIQCHGINDLPYDVRVHYAVTDISTGEIQFSGEKTLPADSSKPLEMLRISLGEQRIFRIDYQYNDQASVNHYLLAAPPVKKDLYKKWLDIFKSINK